jgi:hypothetical protein
MKTSKMYFAAALMSLGAKKTGVDRTDPRHQKFILSYSLPFADEDEWFAQQEEAWNNRTMQVNAQDFVDAIQTLKIEVHKS